MSRSSPVGGSHYVLGGGVGRAVERVVKTMARGVEGVVIVAYRGVGVEDGNK